MDLLLAAILALTALILAPGQFFYFDITPKVVVLLAGTAIATYVALWRDRLRPVGTGGFGALLGLNLLSLAVAAAFCANRNLALYGGTWRRFGIVEQAAAMGFAWLVARRCAGRPERARTILRGVALAGMASAAYGIAQYFAWDPILPKAAYHIGEGVWTIVRPPGTLGYASYFATWLLMVLFLSLALASAETNAAWKRLAWAAAAFALAAMLLTGTRAGILGLAAGLAVWAAGRGFRIPRQWAIGALAVALCGAAFYFSPPGRQMRSRTRWFAEDPWGGARLLLWRDSFRMAAHHLAAGYGPELFYTTFPHFESRDLAKAYPDFVHESPHNMFLDALVAQGISGLAILLGLCAIGLAAAWRARAWWLAAALAAAIVSQQFTVFTAPTALIFFTAIALAVAAAANSTELRGPASAVHFITAALLPVAALGLLYVAARLTAADHQLAITRRSLDSTNVSAAASAYRDYQRWRLPGTSADVWFSRSLMDVARATTDMTVVEQAASMAEDAAENATRTAEDPFSAWYNLAEIRAVHNDYRGTESCLRSAIAAHPMWFKPHWTLAQMLAMESRHDEAEAEAALAVQLDGGKDPEVARTLQQIRSRS